MSRTENGSRPNEVPEAATDGYGFLRFFELSSDLLATLGRDGCFTSLNPAWERLLGWSHSELMARRATDLMHPDDVAMTTAIGQQVQGETSEVVEFENRYRCKDGSYRWLEWNARLEGSTWYAVARDITDRRTLEQQAVHDALTGLVNRATLIDRLSHALARLKRRDGTVGVLFIDLDRFKVINDAKGHKVGDRFLRAVAERLRASLRDLDTISRFGGDEFVIVIEEGPVAGDIAEVGERVIAALERPFMIDGTELWIGASVGIAATGSPDVATETLLHEADVAMYRAKETGGGRCELFDGVMRAEVEQRLEIERSLLRALDVGELCLYYQPIVALPEISVTRCEALIRWRHPTRGLLLPAEFIPLAEDTGMIVQVGTWVLQNACRQAQAWRRSGRGLGITVNVSPRQLAHAGFLEVVCDTLGESGLPPASLCLEITETAIIEHVERITPVLEALHKLGVQIAMDDFGSGYSSLTYLKELPLDIVKIDKSFVAGVLDSSEDRAIVKAILHLAQDTGRSVIAEGIETQALHSQLVGMGCELAQGYLYDRPKPQEELELDGYSSRVRPGIGDPSMIHEFMRQIGIPARIGVE